MKAAHSIDRKMRLQEEGLKHMAHETLACRSGVLGAGVDSWQGSQVIHAPGTEFISFGFVFEDNACTGPETRCGLQVPGLRILSSVLDS